MVKPQNNCIEGKRSQENKNTEHMIPCISILENANQSIVTEADQWLPGLRLGGQEGAGRWHKKT